MHFTPFFKLHFTCIWFSFVSERALQHVSMIFRSESQRWEVVEPLKDIGEDMCIWMSKCSLYRMLIQI